MIYFFHGNDFKKIRRRLKAFIKAVKQKKPEISVSRIDEDNWGEQSLQSLVGEQGLFEKEVLIILDNLLSLGISKDEILEQVKEMKESPNVFVFIETGLDQKTSSIIEKHSEKSEKFSLEKKEERPFNPFALTGALGEKDKRKLWLLYYKAISSGLSAEEIHGVLFWQIKAILLAKELNLKESELKPFAYNKAKNFSNNFSSEELKKISTSLVDIYHGSRMKGLDLSLELEKFILKI